MSVAVITGAGRGFGLEIARRLHARGDTVLLTDIDVAGVEAAAASLGERAHGMAADARDPDAHRAVAARAAGLGRLAVWVNNAGVVETVKVWEHTDAAVARTLDVNVLGVIAGSRAAIEAMRGTGGGHILNLSSMSAFGPVPGLAVYAASKAAVLSFSMSLQGDLDEAGIPIRVHALCPDAADTQMVRDVEHEPDAAILFSGVSLLTADRVADAALALLDGRRIVRAVPAYRAALARFGALAPVAGLKVTHVLSRIGDRHRPQR